MGIGKLKEVDIRELWKHEQYDFSEWLSKKENIENLNEILGLTPEILKKECERQFMVNIFEAYCTKNKQLTDFYNDMYDTLLKCLKTNPERFEMYKKDYPVISSFMIMIPICDNCIEDFKDYLSNM